MVAMEEEDLQVLGVAPLVLFYLGCQADEVLNRQPVLAQDDGRVV
jgi:hypothetical protein